MAIIDCGGVGTSLKKIIEELGNKNYKYICCRVKWTEKDVKYDEFFGACSYIDGKLIPLDGDTYSLEDLYVEWEEDKDEDDNIYLTVWEQGYVTEDWKSVLKNNKNQTRED